MKHNCAEHFQVNFAEDPDAIDIWETSGKQAKYSIGEGITIRGNCSQCGRELGKRYMFTDIIDQETGEVIKE